MSDDERIARLTELARRVPVWCDWQVEVSGDEHQAYVTAIGEGEREVVSIQHAPAGRALDALEAALLVLSGEPMQASEADIAAGVAAMERAYRHGGGTDEALARAAIEAARERRLPLELAPAEPQPDAPTDIAALPDYWDERRRRQGKPDLSRCAAELRIALGKQEP